MSLILHLIILSLLTGWMLGSSFVWLRLAKTHGFKSKRFKRAYRICTIVGTIGYAALGLYFTSSLMAMCLVLSFFWGDDDDDRKKDKPISVELKTTIARLMENMKKQLPSPIPLPQPV